MLGFFSQEEGKELFDDSPVEQRVTEDECVYDLMSDAMTDHSDNVHDSVDADNEVLGCTLCACGAVSECFPAANIERRSCNCGI